MRRSAAVLLCGLVCAALHAPGTARASDSAIAILENCDAAAYPAVSCELVLRNRRGGPIDDAQAVDVSVEIGGAPARVLSLRTLADPAARMHVTVIVDAGVPARSIRMLGDAAAHALDAIDPGDSLSWRVAATASDAQPGPHDVANAAAARAALLVLRPDGRARFFDALCEELAASPPRKRAARMIIVIGDGRDGPARGSTCAPDEALALAHASGVPILSIGVGGAADQRVLNRLSHASGGTHIAAVAKINADDIRHAYARMALRQKARYRLLFDAAAPPALVQRMLVVRVQTGADVLRAESAFVPMPAAPIVDWPALAAAGVPVVAQALPGSERVRVTPRLLGRHIERVEYTLGAHTEVVTQAPFSVTLDTAMLDPNVPTALKIRAYGSAHDMRLYGERVVLLAVADTVAARALAQAGLGVGAATTPSPAVSLAGAAGLASMAVALVGGAAIAHRARRPHMPRRRFYAPAAGAATGDGRADAQTLVRAVAAPLAQGSPRTQPINAAAQPGQAPSGELRLRVTSGAHAGRDIVIPASAEGLVLGRAPHGAHAVSLPSAFLSAAHARFDTAGGLHVTDLNSSNGTRKNGERLIAHARVPLQPRDAVTLADVELQVVAV